MEKLRFTHQSTDTGSELEIVQEPRGSFKIMNTALGSNVSRVHRRGATAAAVAHPPVIYKEEKAKEQEASMSTVTTSPADTTDDDADSLCEDAQPVAATSPSPATPPKRVDDSFKDFINMTKRRPRTPTPKAPTPKPAEPTPRAPVEPKKPKGLSRPGRKSAPPPIADTSSEGMSDAEDMSDAEYDANSVTYTDAGTGAEAASDAASDTCSEMSLRDTIIRNQDDTPALKHVKGNMLTDIKKSDSQVGNGMSATHNYTTHDKVGVQPAQMPQGMPQAPPATQPAGALRTVQVNAMEDASRPMEGFASVEDEKIDLLFKLDRMRRRNFKVRPLDDSSSIVDVRKEYTRIKNELELEHSINLSRKVLMAIVSTIEFLNKKYDPFDLALNGWSESIMENINSYDNVLERLYYKYRSKVAMPPELEILMTLAGSAFMFHMTNSLFKSMASSLGAGAGADGSGSAKNPDLLQSIMSAFANIASKNAAPAPQQAPPPQPQQPSSHPPIHTADEAGHRRAPAIPSEGQQPPPHSATLYAWHQQQQPQQQPQQPLPMYPTMGAPRSVAQPPIPQQQYRMRGPDVDLNSVLGGAAGNMLPGIVGLMGGMAGGAGIGEAPPAFVPSNPISSSAVVMPRRAIEDDERFSNRINAPLPAMNTILSAGAGSTTMNGRAESRPDGAQVVQERPFFPDPPMIPPTASPAVAAPQQQPRMSLQVNVPVLAKPMATPALLDEERLSDINTADLESIHTDALESVVSDDDSHGIVVRRVPASSNRKEARMARNSGVRESNSGSKGKSTSGGTKRNTRQGGKIMVF